MDDARPLSQVESSPEALLGYVDPSAQPQATGTDKLVLKRGNLFLVANRLGDVSPPGARDLGLFLTDTRHLSAWRLEMQGGPPLCLASQVSAEYVAQIDFTVTSLHDGDLLGTEPVNFVHLRREQLIDDVFVDRLALTNFLAHPVDFWLALSWAADFADVFEIRGARRSARGTYLVPRVEADQVVLRYDGLDGRCYATEIRVDGVSQAEGAPARLASLGVRGARVEFRLPPGVHAEVMFSVACGIERTAPGVARGPDEDRPVPQRIPHVFDALAAETRGAYDHWARQATRFTSTNGRLDAALAHAVADLKALTVYHFGRPVISAGIPWYTCPFGRDALISGFEALLAAPEIARDALVFLARLQGSRDDPERDEEPGKIPHEIRFGEMAVAGEVPHSPYYGSADATPLFLVLLDEYERWTADSALVDSLLPAAERALAWLDSATARDGLVWYARRAPKGLRNQGWKDSHDGVPFADGRAAEPPIALVEVQGYAVDARRRMADAFERRGRAEDAARLRRVADAHAQAIEERFWMARAGTYAIALDRDGRQVDAVTSNPGHLLFSGVPSPERARSVVATLLGRGGWSGWGIRTLASGQPAYNPLSYHDGTVWPHDNALCAMGFARYGMTHEAGQVFLGLWDAAQHFRQQRLPELFCGLSRDGRAFPVSYPVACSPQAWSSAAWFLLLRATLGLSADAPAGVLHIGTPSLPPFLEGITLEGLRIGAAHATLRFVRGVGGGAAVEVVSVKRGPLRVRVDL
jgi:glycogen debranching enzyme